MKQLIIKNTPILSLLLLSACGTTPTVAPSQNKALNSISSSNAQNGKQAGFMQNSLDSWTQDEWTPKVEANPEIQKKYMKVDENAAPIKSEKSDKKEVVYKEREDKAFTLQELVDKTGAYLEATPSKDESKSNVKHMQSLPVIGK